MTLRELFEVWDINGTFPDETHVTVRFLQQNENPVFGWTDKGFFADSYGWHKVYPDNAMMNVCGDMDVYRWRYLNEQPYDPNLDIEVFDRREKIKDFTDDWHYGTY